MMRTRLKLKPGQRGTRKIYAEYGKRLVCVRYRYDEKRKKRYKTIELIVEEVDWRPRPKGDSLVKIWGQWNEPEIAQKLKKAGGVWNSRLRLWELRYDRVVALGLKYRMVETTGI